MAGPKMKLSLHLEVPEPMTRNASFQFGDEGDEGEKRAADVPMGGLDHSVHRPRGDTPCIAKGSTHFTTSLTG